MAVVSNARFLRDIEARRRLPGSPSEALDIGDHRVLEPEEVTRLSRIYLAGERAGGILGISVSEQDDRAVRRAVREGRKAKEQLVLHNMRLVSNEAHKYSFEGMTFDDHFQNGCLGLNRAVEKFDPDTGFQFSTYATWWIRQSITRGVADMSRLIRLPVHVVDELKRFTNARTRLTGGGERVTAKSVAREAGITVERAEELEKLRGRTASLDEVIGDGLTTLGDLQPARESGVDPVERVEMEEEVAGLLGQLNRRERDIMVLRFGLDRREPRTLEEVGGHFGLTRERIRQIEAVALKRLRRLVGAGVRRPVVAKARPDLPGDGDGETGVDKARLLRGSLSDRNVGVLDRLAAAGGRLTTGELLEAAAVRNPGFVSSFHQKIRDVTASLGIPDPLQVDEGVVEVSGNFMDAWNSTRPEGQI